MTTCTSPLIAIWTYSFSGSSRKEDQITCNKLAAWHGWQTIVYNESVMWLFCIFVLEFYRSVLRQSCSMFTDSFVHHHRGGGGAFSWSFITCTIITSKSVFHSDYSSSWWLYSVLRLQILSAVLPVNKIKTTVPSRHRLAGQSETNLWFYLWK